MAVREGGERAGLMGASAVPPPAPPRAGAWPGWSGPASQSC
jgi:hypothetical protein